MTRGDSDDFLEDIDFCIREANGGWIVMAPSEFLNGDDETVGLATAVHVFTEVEAVLAFLKERMEWFKRERNKGCFDHGDDDYPGEPGKDVTPPRDRAKK